MNLLYEKTRLMGGRMFRSEESDDSTDSSSASATNGHDSQSDSYGGDSGSYNGGGFSTGSYGDRFSGYNLADGLGSIGGLGLTSTSSASGLNLGYAPSDSYSYSLADGLSVQPGQIGMTTQPGISADAASLLGMLGRFGISAALPGPFGALLGRAAQAYAEKNLPGSTYAWGVNGSPISGDVAASASFGGSGSADYTANNGLSSGNTTGNMQMNDLASLFSIFGAGAASPSYAAPQYQDDPYGALGDAVNNRNTYASNFNDTYGLLRGQVMQFNDPAYMAAQRGQRMADVQQQSDAAYQSALRDRMRLGMNPNDGAFAAMAGQRAMQTALGKVKAASDSDKDLRSAYMTGLGGLSSMNTDFGKVGAAWGQLGLDATKAKNTFNLQSSDLGLKANGGTLDWAKLGMDKYRADKGLEGTKYGSDASNDVNWGALAAGSLLNNDKAWDAVSSWF